MWAAEMMNSCGLNAWACNSQVVHATSPSLLQRFTRVGALRFDGGSGGGAGGSPPHNAAATVDGDGAAADTNPVQPRFAHEPNVVRGPGGEWVMFWTGCDPAAPPGSPTSCSPRFTESTSAADCRGLGDGSTPPGVGLHRGGRSNDYVRPARI